MQIGRYQKGYCRIDLGCRKALSTKLYVQTLLGQAAALISDAERRGAQEYQSAMKEYTEPHGSLMPKGVEH